MKHNKHGVTLVELMVVVCLVMLLACLAFTNLSFLDETIAHAQIDKLYVVCHYLRQQAMATNSEITLKFDLSNNSYSYENHMEKLSGNVAFGFLNGTKGPPGNPQGSVTSAITFPSREIHFYPTGIISSGTLYLIDKKKKHMYALSNAVSTVSYLRLYKYTETWKLCD